MFGADGAFEHLQRGVMRAGQFLHHDRNVGEIARHLQRFIEGNDRLRRHRSAQRRDIAAARAFLQPVDAGPFADIVAVGRTAIEHLLLQPRHDRTLDAVLLAVRIARRETNIEPGFFEQFFLDADDDRKIENRIVWSNPDEGLFLRHRNGVLCLVKVTAADYNDNNLPAKSKVLRLRPSLRGNPGGFGEIRIDRKLFLGKLVELLGRHRHGLHAEVGKLFADRRNL